LQQAERKRAGPVAVDDDGTLEAIEQRTILQALERTHGNRTEAARLLGVTRRTLGYRIRKYALDERVESLRGAGGDPSGRIAMRRVAPRVRWAAESS
jgi:DNA-binding NtrC family response regulator